MSIRRINAIFEKDIKDLMKNLTMLITMFTPIIIALVLGRVRNGAELTLAMVYIIVGGTFAVVTTGTIMSMMAEENEKKTLRGLIQSPASLLDIIIGKSLVTVLATLFTLIVSLLIVGIGPFLDLKAVLGLVLLLLFFLLLGIGFALSAKSVAGTTAYLMPFTFLFGFTPMIGTLGLLADNSIGLRILDKFPVMQAVQAHDTSSWMPMGIIGIWVLGAAIFTYLCFRKTRMDD
ncbi:ABC transporter permease subunit [Paenibacillus sp. MMS20-IR301]|uniref:ABC transporter permease subunit n=1 Tax=Paenibacillus sp. MMS20-IR301 TaxID=2895946 RepID=UPI0028E4A851|nr:ABC transporter permease subunit [Paenibacillus sp. MMS20-IR301]WNS45194.1 ABC transporter permease [Paenibacillus sp. MMS20-IR301]